MHYSTDYSTNIKRRSLSEEFEALKVTNPAFMQAIAIAGEAKNTKHEWFDQALSPVSTQLNDGTGINSSDTTLTVDSSTGFAAGDIIYFEDNTAFDLAKIVTVDSGTQLTVTRGYGGSIAASHLDDCVIALHSRPKIEGSTQSATAISEPTLYYNYTQIFRRDVSVAGSAKSIINYVVSDLIAEGVAQRMREIYWEINKALISGGRYDAGTPASVARTAGGLLWFINTYAPAAHKVDALGVTLETGTINGVIESIIKAGGRPNALAMSTTQARKIAGLNSITSNVLINVDQMSTTAGIPAPTKFFGDLPNIITDLIIDINIPKDKILVVDTSKIKVVPLKGNEDRSIAEIDTTLPSTDAYTRRVLGEYTFEFRNPAESFGYIYNLKTT